MDLVQQIKQLKKEKNAVILAHCYQNVEIDEVADYVGDSLYLSQMAAKTNADIIVFAGVYFMAQTAKILCPDKKVLLPNLNSGCAMADMVNINQLREFKSQNNNAPTVCYINSTAEVKAECDICCTSSNAVSIVKSLNVDEVLFLPDNYLGKWVEHKLGNVKVTTYNGHCPTHQSITPEDIHNIRAKYPNALILTHPECRVDVTTLSDFVGSTKEIMEFAAKSEHNQFIIVTEKGVVDRLTRDYPTKEFILLKESLICPSMKLNTLESIYNVLKTEQNEIFVDDEVSKKAVQCINRMLDASK
ncbi:quinolinate synthase NadA [bacterium]|nr:quinolinate synthase NadA [bacterium]